MNTKEEFDVIWNDLTQVVISKVYKNLNAKILNLYDIQISYDNQIQHWEHGMLREKRWLDKIKVENPDKASNILQIVKSFKIQKSNKNIPSLNVCYVILTVIAVITYLIVGMFDLSTLKHLLVTVSVLIIGAAFIIPIGQTRQNKAKKLIADDCKKQLDEAKEQILNILTNDYNK